MAGEEGQGSALDPLGAAPPDLHFVWHRIPQGDSVLDGPKARVWGLIPAPLTLACQKESLGSAQTR